jgi:hypothetical protein
MPGFLTNCCSKSSSNGEGNTFWLTLVVGGRWRGLVMAATFLRSWVTAWVSSSEDPALGTPPTVAVRLEATPPGASSVGEASQ